MLSMNDISAALAALDQSQFDGLQLLDAEAVAAQHYPLLDPSQPALLIGVEDQEIARRLAATLSQAYPAEHAAQWVTDRERRDITIGAFGETVAARGHLFIPPRTGASTYEALQNIAARLRAPDGCPWDRALTWPKLRASLLEETYELLAALDASDSGKVLEEQGDLLLQVALQAQIATEEGRYRLPEVIARIVDKLIRRHPHVFGDIVVSGTDEVLANWEAIKAAERAQNGEQKRSPLAGVPAGLPALAQAEAYLDRMSRLRPHVPQALPWEPLSELAPEAELTSELLGEVLFGIVGWAMSRGVEAESALREANERFAARVATEEWG
jgi:tetrapyrrole methylase family protein/MazG family protein